MESFGRDHEVQIPRYTEKKALTKPGRLQKPSKFQVAVAYEATSSGGSFVNISRHSRQDELELNPLQERQSQEMSLVDDEEDSDPTLLEDLAEEPKINWV